MTRRDTRRFSPPPEDSQCRSQVSNDDIEARDDGESDQENKHFPEENRTGSATEGRTPCPDTAGSVVVAMDALMDELTRRVVRALRNSFPEEGSREARASDGSVSSTQQRSAFQYLTVGDVAERLKVTEPTVRGWVKKGVLRAIILPGGRNYRIKRSDLAQFEDSHAASQAKASQDIDGQAAKIIDIANKRIGGGAKSGRRD